MQRVQVTLSVREARSVHVLYPPAGGFYWVFIGFLLGFYGFYSVFMVFIGFLCFLTMLQNAVGYVAI